MNWNPNSEATRAFARGESKDTMKDIGVKRLTVRYRVRNEHWTEQMYKDAIVKARQTIYGSQW